jgi:hypothetical protein
LSWSRLPCIAAIANAESAPISRTTFLPHAASTAAM